MSLSKSRVSIFCAECERIVQNSVEVVHWFELSFCAIKCLSKYYHKNATKCGYCDAQLTAKKIYVHKSPSSPLSPIQNVQSSNSDSITVSSSSILDARYFCSVDCLNGFKDRFKLCKYCLRIASDNKIFCSGNCQYLTRICNTKNVQLSEKCSNCESHANVVIRATVDGNQYKFCSERCFDKLTAPMEVAFDLCVKCLQQFKNVNNIAYVVQESSCDNVFCDVACLNNFLLTNAKIVECYGCKKGHQYCQMIRGSSRINCRAWCSLDCATNADFTALMGIIVPNQSSDPEHAPHEPFDPVPASGLAVVQKDAHQESYPKAGNGNDAYLSVVSYTHCKIQPLSSDETNKMLLERLVSFERKCSACESKICNTVPFLRWQTEEFCNGICFGEFINGNNGSLCWACDAIISQQNLCLHTEYIENKLRLFCSFECKTQYSKLVKMCDFCHKIMKRSITIGQQAQRFCSMDCQVEHRMMYSLDTVQEMGICTDCNMMKPVNVVLIYQEKTYQFCSYTCFFFVKYSCGLYPDKCIACNKFFIRCADNCFTVRYDNMTNILCSEMCLTHFMLKHRSTVECSFCHDRNYNFNMLQQLSDRATKIQYFCSKTCLDLLYESENAVAVFLDEEGFDEECIQYVPVVEMIEDSKPVRSVGVQTDLPCKCNQENIRKKLVPVLPGKRSVIDSSIGIGEKLGVISSQLNKKQRQ